MLEINAESVRRLFSYDPETGDLAWKEPGPRRVVGRPFRALDHDGYRVVKLNKRLQTVHRLIWLHVHGVWPQGQIDHMNGIRTDNRLSNLRDVTTGINTQNMRVATARSKSGVLGVRQNGKRWAASLGVKGKVLHLGTYDSPEEAHAAYVAAKRVHHAGCTL